MTQKPGSDRALAIALEGVTQDAVTGKPGSAAPRVTASGRGAVAEQILQIAFERGVKVRTDSDLAEIVNRVRGVQAAKPAAELVQRLVGRHAGDLIVQNGKMMVEVRPGCADKDGR